MGLLHPSDTGSDTGSADTGSTDTGSDTGMHGCPHTKQTPAYQAWCLQSGLLVGPAPDSLAALDMSRVGDPWFV